jgi:WD40 repeat protein
MLAIGNSNGAMELWNVNNWNFVKEFTNHRSNINDIKFSLNSDFIFTSSFDKTVKIYSLNTL